MPCLALPCPALLRFVLPYLAQHGQLIMQKALEHRAVEAAMRRLVLGLVHGLTERPQAVAPPRPLPGQRFLELNPGLVLLSPLVPLCLVCPG